MKLMMGCDPEFFLRDFQNDKTLMSCGIVGGMKGAPKQISEKVSVHEDNVTVEMNMSAVEHEPGSLAFRYAASEAFDTVEEYLRTHLKNKHIGLLVFPEQSFDKKLLEKTPGAMVFGCDPDLNAYRDGGRNPTFGPADVGTMRFAGGHIHLGYDWKECRIPRPSLVIMLEALCLVPWSAKTEVIGDNRVKFYGRPGAYREKPYGLEWRTPSANWMNVAQYCQNIGDTAHWLIHNPDAARIIYEQIDFEMVQKLLTNNLKDGVAATFRKQMRELAAPIYAAGGINAPVPYREQVNMMEIEVY